MKRIEIPRTPYWLALTQSILTVILVFLATDERLNDNFSVAELVKFLFTYFLFSLVPWISVVYQYFFQPQYFVSWNEQQISWQLPGMKSIQTIERSAVTDITYKPFVIKVATPAAQHEIDISPFKDKAAEQIKAGLLG